VKIDKSLSSYFSPDGDFNKLKKLLLTLN
jgi:hypothetical protein